MSLLSYKLI